MIRIDDAVRDLFRKVIEEDDCAVARDAFVAYLRDHGISEKDIVLGLAAGEEDEKQAEENQKFLIDYLKNELERVTGKAVLLPNASDLERFKVFMQLCNRKFGLSRGWKNALSARTGISLEEIRRYETGSVQIPDSVFDEVNKLPDFKGEDESDLPEEVAQAIIDHQFTPEEVNELIEQKRKTVRHRASQRDLAVADALIDYYNCTIPDTGLLLRLTEGQIRSSYHNKVRKPRIVSQEVAKDDRPMDRDELLRIGIKLNNRKGSMQGAKRALSEFLEIPHTTINAWDARREPIPPELAKKLRDWYHSE